MQLKLDLHVHSCYSADSVISFKELVFYAKKRGLQGVAITDHDRIDGAQKIAKETQVLAIPGIEVTSKKGHVLGLGINECIPRDLSVDETVERIHQAGGIAVACHPTTLIKGGLEKHITPKFDAVETINASAIPFERSVRLSQGLASRVGISVHVGGSDAHYPPEIGHAYTIVDAEVEVDDVIRAIREDRCKPFGGAIPASMRLKRAYWTTLKRLRMPYPADTLPRI